MGQLKLMGMKAIKDIKSTEDVDIVEMLLVTDPLKITHYINFWRQEAMVTTATAENKARAEKMATMLLNYAERQCTLTCSVYSFAEEATPVTTVIEPASTVKDTKVTEPIEGQNTKVTPADVTLRVVKDEEIIAPDENRILRVKYADIIKKKTVDDIKQMVKDLIKDNKESDGVELATFILSGGLYTGKKVKQWSKEKIDSFLNSCKNGDTNHAPTTKVEQTTTTTETTATETMESQDIDLYKKYANFLGDNAITLAGLKVETKFQLSNGNLDQGMELATFLLTEGLCSDESNKWSPASIEEWFKAIKQDMIDNPLVLNPNNEEAVDVSKIDTGSDKAKDDTKEEVDIKMIDLYANIKNMIITDGKAEEDVKTYVLNTIKSSKVENLVMYYGVENTQEELESMYATFFISFVANAFEEKGVAAMDIKEEIVKLIQKCIDKKEKTLGSAIQSAGVLYRQKGETVTIKEVRDVVCGIAADQFPEYYATVVTALGKSNKETNKPSIVQSAENFPTKYPEIWDKVKDAKTLDDVYQMARELEKTHSFMIVSEMIIYLISSGNIRNKDGIVLCEKDNTAWDTAMIEMWINQMFTKAPTVVEAEGKMMPDGINKDGTTKLVDPTTPAASTETVLEGKTSDGIVDPNSPVKVDIAAGTTETKVVTESAKTVPLTTAEIEIPKAYVIPDDKKAFRDLYALNSTNFWQGFINNITRLETEGKSKKEIIHTMADVIKEIAKNDELTQCFARNFKRTNITEMYKVIETKAHKLEMPSW